MSAPKPYSRNFVHHVDFECDDYEGMNDSTLKNRGLTFEEIAQNNPINAFNLFYKFLSINPQVKTRISMQTEHSRITSLLDGDFAARGALMTELGNNIVGSMIVRPTTIVVSSFSDIRHYDGIPRSNIDFPLCQFSIEAKPPALAM